MKTNSKSYIFHVDGMHCASCKLLVETELKDLSYVTAVKADPHTGRLEVTGDFEGISAEVLAQDFSTLLAHHRYVVSAEKNDGKMSETNWRDFAIALPVAIGFMTLFILLQKIGLVNLINADSMSYGTSFLIGVIASVSSCMAIVGGLLLSMSATFAKGGDKTKPQFLFHAGRLISFFLLGGVIGVIGATFHISTTATFLLGIIVGLIMLIIGINLLGIFHFSKKFQVTMPQFISRNALKVSNINHSITPFLVGIVTFFLPCGFTQSMQIYTLSTGNFWVGGMTMLSFALGTLPALAIISFSSLSFQGRWSRVFFKTAGIIVIMFALLNIINSLVVIGVVRPFLNF